MSSPVYWWGPETWEYEMLEQHPTPGRWAFVEDKQWSMSFAKAKGWVADESV